jgi:hypothetical protein
MQDEHSNQTNQPGRNLDERLSAYYGPAIPDQPLPSSSWSHLSAQLGPQQQPRRIRIARSRRRQYFKMRDFSLPPSYILAAFSRIADEAGFPFVRPMLTCRFDMQVSSPELHVSLLGKRHIHLYLPLDARESMIPSALDVLLGTGLARYLQMRKPAYLIQRLVLLAVVIGLLAACIAFLTLFQQGITLVKYPIAIGLNVMLDGLIVRALFVQSRRMAIQADELLLLWLGRRQVCQGLHVLADLSRTPTHRKFGDLSLTERIERVCGTHVSAHEERLTLVR